MGLTNPSGSSIKSIQRGTIAVANAAGTQNVTISAVDLAKSVVIVPSGGGTTFTVVTMRLTSSTNLAVQNNGSSGGSLDWQVVEYV